jgi:hypothetical protein
MKLSQGIYFESTGSWMGRLGMSHGKELEFTTDLNSHNYLWQSFPTIVVVRVAITGEGS